jgi:hypothetical protein
MFEEEMRNYNQLSEEIRKNLGTIEYLLEDEIVDMGVGKLQETLNIATQFEEKILTSKLLPEDRNNLISRVRKIKSKLSSAIELWKRIDVNVEVKLSEKKVKIDKPFKVDLTLRNNNPFDILVKLDWIKPERLQIVALPPRNVQLKARQSKTINLLFKGSNEGAFIIKPFKITCESKGMKEEITTEPLQVEIESLKPLLSIIKNVNKTSIYEGEEIEIMLTITNKGEGVAENVYLKDNIDGLKLIEGITEWRGNLAPGQSQSISYKIIADASRRELKPAFVTFLDKYGKQSSIQSNAISINVLPIEKQPEIKEERKPEIFLSIEDIINEIGKLAIPALVGYSIASISPKKREVAKKVVIEEGIRWEKEKYGNQEVTILLEHPIAVVKEEYKTFIKYRKATPFEIFHSVDSLTTKKLQEQFIHIMRGILNRWRPIEGSDIIIDAEEYSNVEIYRKRIENILQKHNETIDEEKFRKLPKNPSIIYTYYRKSFLRKEVLMKVYIKTYADIEKLYFDEVDHTPMNLSCMEVSNFIRNASQLDYPVIAILCSPTGWDEETKNFAQEASDPKMHLMFIDLKTMDSYFNKNKNELVKLFEIMPKVELIYPVELEEKEIEKLDNLLLNGSITLSDYTQRVKELQLKSVKKSKDQSRFSFSVS